LPGSESTSLQPALPLMLKMLTTNDVWAQTRLFIIFGVCGLIVQTLLLRVLLSWFNESRVLVIGESSQPPLCSMC